MVLKNENGKRIEKLKKARTTIYFNYICDCINGKQMKIKQIYIISLVLSIFGLVTGSMFKIMHWPYATILNLTGYLFSLAYITIGIVTLFKNKDKSLIEKLAWTIGFLIFSSIIGIVYFFTELKNIKQSRTMDDCIDN